MNLCSLLRRRLKDDEVLEVLEAYQIDDVFYSFDRLHENTPDKYWAQAKQAGFQLGFDQEQILYAVFCYIVEAEGFLPIEKSLIGAPVYSTFGEAEAAARASSLRYSVSGPRAPEAWLRTETAGEWINYQFKDGALALVSLFIPW